MARPGNMLSWWRWCSLLPQRDEVRKGSQNVHKVDMGEVSVNGIKMKKAKLLGERSQRKGRKCGWFLQRAWWCP